MNAARLLFLSLAASLLGVDAKSPNIYMGGKGAWSNLRGIYIEDKIAYFQGDNASNYFSVTIR